MKEAALFIPVCLPWISEQGAPQTKAQDKGKKTIEYLLCVHGLEMLSSNSLSGLDEWKLVQSA